MVGKQYRYGPQPRTRSIPILQRLGWANKAVRRTGRRRTRSRRWCRAKNARRKVSASDDGPKAIATVGGTDQTVVCPCGGVLHQARNGLPLEITSRSDGSTGRWVARLAAKAGAYTPRGVGDPGAIARTMAAPRAARLCRR